MQLLMHPCIMQHTLLSLSPLALSLSLVISLPFPPLLSPSRTLSLPPTWASQAYGGERPPRAQYSWNESYCDSLTKKGLSSKGSRYCPKRHFHSSPPAYLYHVCVCVCMRVLCMHAHVFMSKCRCMHVCVYTHSLSSEKPSGFEVLLQLDSERCSPYILTNDYFFGIDRRMGGHLLGRTLVTQAPVRFVEVEDLRCAGGEGRVQGLRGVASFRLEVFWVCQGRRAGWGFGGVWRVAVGASQQSFSMP
jgi:hypothetical protein